MRRISVVILIAVGFVLGSLSLGAATASNSERANDNGDTIRVTAVSDQSEEIDARPKGLSVGDYLAFSDNLKKKGDEVGQLDGVCHVSNVDGDDYRAVCSVVATLDDEGTITHQGVFESTEDEATFAITGGTGDYTDASGETTVKFVSDTRAKIKIELD
jgi:hypothetical protein